MCNYPKKVSGFTLLELMVTIAVAGVLIGLAIPSFSDMMRNNRLTTYTNELVTALNLARSEAVKRGTNVIVAAVAQGTGNYWSTSGWNVFVDNNSNNIFDATDTLIKTYAAPPSSIVIAGNYKPFGNVVNRITYKPDGSIDGVGSSIAICADVPSPIPTSYAPKPYASRLITISNIGRIRIATDINSDGIPEKNKSTTLSDCLSP